MKLDEILGTIIDEVHFECKYNVLEGNAPDYTKIDSYAKAKLQALIKAEIRKEVRAWAIFFSDPSMNSMTPSERLYKRIEELNKYEN